MGKQIWYNVIFRQDKRLKFEFRLPSARVVEFGTVLVVNVITGGEAIIVETIHKEYIKEYIYSFSEKFIA